MSETLQRKALPVAAWHLAESMDPETERTITLQEKVFTAIAELAELGWRGVMTYPRGQMVLEFNSDADETVAAVKPQAGDWLVLDIGLLRVFNDADCAANYDVAEV